MDGLATDRLASPSNGSGGSPMSIRTRQSAVFATLAASVMLPVRHTRRIGKKDLALNDVLPSITIDPERYVVTIDGERIEPRAAARLPLAQRYFLF